MIKCENCGCTVDQPKNDSIYRSEEEAKENVIKDVVFFIGEPINDNIVSQEKFATMINSFQDKFKKLYRIKNGYKYSIKVIGDTWYCISVDDLP